MVEKTKVDTVLDEVFKKPEFKLYCRLDRADIGENLALKSSWEICHRWAKILLAVEHKM